jgi:hypothetical protein
VTISIADYCRDRRATEVALTGGHWERRGLIQVWVPSDSSHPLDITTLIACPTCGAHVHEPCRTTSGRSRIDHATRLVSRRCECGASLEPRRTYCTPCARISHQAAKRIYVQRKRSAA